MDDLGFSFRQMKNGDVVISHHGKRATTLRSDKAAAFLEDMNGVDTVSQQQEMARLTGNYRRAMSEPPSGTHETDSPNPKGACVLWGRTSGW